MQIPFTIYISVTVINVVLFLIWKRLKEDTVYFWDYAPSMFLPLLNILNSLVCVFNISAILTKKHMVKRNSKKHPEIAALNVLKEILKKYKSEINLHNKNAMYRQIQIACNEEKGMEFKKMVDLDWKFQSLFEYLEKECNKPEITKLFLENEITFTRILTIINESEKINEDLTSELLMISRETLMNFHSEVMSIKLKEEKIKNETEEATRNRLIEELKDEVMYQNNRARNLI